MLCTSHQETQPETFPQYHGTQGRPSLAERQIVIYFVSGKKGSRTAHNLTLRASRSSLRHDEALSVLYHMADQSSLGELQCGEMMDFFPIGVPVTSQSRRCAVAPKTAFVQTPFSWPWKISEVA